MSDFRRRCRRDLVDAEVGRAPVVSQHGEACDAYANDVGVRDLVRRAHQSREGSCGI
jgi:hypothetical protein